MRTREISSEQWQPFFSDFTQLHQGEHINVETLGDGGIGIKSQLYDLPLVGVISAHPSSATEEWIEVIAGDAPESHQSCSIPEPAKVRVAEEEGQAVALQIESADGSITMIRFQPPRENLPEGFRVF